ncbi:MAG: hypothetical protein LBS59_03030 [Puniceicoccales bacterium]|jgi:hypothetical protein|nr:hypothetical protein [Puniceicoccales bacterium]
MALKKLTPLTWPTTLTDKSWQKAKSVLTQKTGLGANLTETKKLFDVIKWTTFDPSTVKSGTSWDAFTAHLRDKWKAQVEPVKERVLKNIRDKAEAIARDKRTDRKTKAAAEEIAKAAEFFATSLQLDSPFFVSAHDNAKELFQGGNKQDSAQLKSLVTQLKEAVEIREGHTAAIERVIADYEGIYKRLLVLEKKPNDADLRTIKAALDIAQRSERARVDENHRARENTFFSKEDTNRLKAMSDTPGVDKLIKRYDFNNNKNKEVRDKLVGIATKVETLYRKLALLALDFTKDITELRGEYAEELHALKQCKLARFSVNLDRTQITTKDMYDFCYSRIVEKINQLKRAKAILEHLAQIERRVEKLEINDIKLVLELEEFDEKRRVSVSLLKHNVGIIRNAQKLIATIDREKLPD